MNLLSRIFQNQAKNSERQGNLPLPVTSLDRHIEVKRLLDEGTAMRRKNDYVGAKRAYCAALEIDPTELTVFWLLAKTCYLLEQRDESILNYVRFAHLVLPQLRQQVAGDPKIREQLMAADQDLGLRRINDEALYLLRDPDTPSHIAHAFLDFRNAVSKSPQLLAHIAAYKSSLAGQRVTLERHIEETVYRPVGLQLLAHDIQWDQASDTRVLDVYPSSSVLKHDTGHHVASFATSQPDHYEFSTRSVNPTTILRGGQTVADVTEAPAETSSTGDLIQAKNWTDLANTKAVSGGVSVEADNSLGALVATVDKISRALPESYDHSNDTSFDRVALQGIKRGDVLVGRIVNISARVVSVDVGSEEEGVIAGNQLSQISPDVRDSFRTDDEIEVQVVEIGEEGEAIALALVQHDDWARAEELKEKQRTYIGTVSGYNRGGLTVMFGKIPGFVPSSQIVSWYQDDPTGDLFDRMASMQGRELQLRIVKVDRASHQLLFAEVDTKQPGKANRESRTKPRERPMPAYNPPVTLQDVAEVQKREPLVELTLSPWLKRSAASRAIQTKLIRLDDDYDFLPDDELCETATEALLPVFGLDKYFVYLRNSGTGRMGDLMIEIVFATDIDHGPNQELIGRLRRRTLSLIGVQEQRYYGGRGARFSIIKLELLPERDGVRTAWSKTARVEFGATSTRTGQMAGMTPSLITAISRMPEANRQREIIHKRLADWLKYLEVLKSIAEKKQFNVPYKAYRLNKKTVEFHLDAIAEAIPWARVQSAIAEPINLAEITESLAVERALAVMNGEEVNTDYETNDWLIGTLDKCQPDKNAVIITLEEDIVDALGYGRVTIPPKGVLRYKASGDLSQIRRLKSGIEALETGHAENSRLSDFVFDATKARLPDELTALRLSREQLLQPQLNAKQLQAVEGALNAPDLYLIQGPPGTGKTTVIAEICYQNALLQKRTLIASQANLAVDNAMSRLVHHPAIRGLRRGRADRVEEEGKDYLEDRVIGAWLKKVSKGCRHDLELREQRLYEFQGILGDHRDIQDFLNATRNYRQAREQQAQRIQQLKTESESAIQRTFAEIAQRISRLPQNQWQVGCHAAARDFAMTTAQARAANTTTPMIELIDQIGHDLRQNTAQVMAQLTILQTELDNTLAELAAAKSAMETEDQGYEQRRQWWISRLASIPDKVRPPLLGRDSSDPNYVSEVLATSQRWKERYDQERTDLERRKKITTDWAQRLEHIDSRDEEDLRRIYIDNANVIGITCVQAGARHFSEEYRNFDCVIIDEVSKSTPPELLLPMLKGTKIVLVGDSRQLPPMVDTNTILEIAEAANIAEADMAHLKRSLFRELFEACDEASGLRVMLTDQYRMHPQIMTAINQFYHGELECRIKDPDTERAHGCEPVFEREQHLVWMSTPVTSEFHETRVGFSYRNQQEVEIIMDCLQQLDAAWAEKVADLPEPEQRAKEVGVITFYAAQLKELRQQIDRQNFKNLKIRTGTVDRFQGMERPIIIVSLVRNNLQNDIGFAKEKERINVAFSRAQELLIIVGARDMFCKRTNHHAAAEVYARVAEAVQAAKGIKHVPGIN